MAPLATARTRPGALGTVWPECYYVNWYNSAGALGTVWPECYYVNWYNSEGALGTEWPEYYYVNLCGTTQRGRWELYVARVLLC